MSVKDRTLPVSEVARRKHTRLVITLVLLGAVLVYVLVFNAKGTAAVATVAKISPKVFLMMVGTYVLYVLIHGIFYRSVYQAVGLSRKVREMAALFLKMNLANTLAPVAGLSGAAYMVYAEQRRGTDHSVAVLINFLYYAIDYAVFLLVLSGGIGYLSYVGLITPGILIPSSIFVGITLGFFLAGAFLFSHPSSLYAALSLLVRLYGRIRSLPMEGHTAKRAVTYAESIRAVWLRSHARWRYLLKAALAASCQHVACIFLLYLAFAAVAVPVSPGILAIGYTVGTLLHIVSITPGGIGFAEGGMTAIFVALGIPVGQAVVVVLLYRSIFAGLPLILAVPFMHSSEVQGGNTPSSGI